MRNWINNNGRGCLVILAYSIFLIIIPFIIVQKYYDTDKNLSQFAFIVLFLSVGFIGYLYDKNKKKKR